MLFRKKIERSCTYCIHGTQLDDESVLCIKKGVMLPNSSCRKFEYDPLNRTPARPVSFGEFSAEDFEL